VQPTLETGESMVSAETFRREVRPPEHGLFKFMRFAWLMVPFLVNALFGFEWAVLVGMLVGTQHIAGMIRAVVLDTTAINLLKQHEHKLWNPDPER
jgi:hypothetical protein